MLVKLAAKSLAIMSALGVVLAGDCLARAAKLGTPVLVADLQDAREVYYWAATGDDGSVHVVYNGKYRFGPTCTQLGSEETITTELCKNPKLDVSPSGIPHLVFQKGAPSGRGATYYTVRKDGKWNAPEKVAVASELGVGRAYLPDVAANAAGDALVCFWADGSKYQGAVYRWRSPDGTWSDFKGNLSAYHAATPKVEEHKGSFYLHYAKTDFDKRLSGPVAAGGTFDAGTRFRTDVGGSYQNEGVTFAIASDGTVAATGARRKWGKDRPNQKPSNSVGLWVTDNQSGVFVPTLLSPEWPGTRGDESAYHPSIAIDEATGAIVVVVQAESDGKPYYAIKENGTWSPVMRLYPEEDTDKWEGFSLRNGPSVADVPGPGVVAMFRCVRKVYLRTITPESAHKK